MSTKKLDIEKRERPSVVRRFMTDQQASDEQAPGAENMEQTVPPAPVPAGNDHQSAADGVVPRGVMGVSPAGRKYYFYNTLEDTAIGEIEATILHIDMCKCDKCFSDICSIVLNSLKPHYVTTTMGGLLDRAALLNVDVLSRISVEIFKAVDIVKKNPSHDA